LHIKSGISKLSPDRFKYQILPDTKDFKRNKGCINLSCSTNKRFSGMTIVEMVIIIAIIGILASVAAPTYTGYVEKARVQRSIADLRRISLIIEKYRRDEGFFPVSLNDVWFSNDLDPWGNQYQYLNTDEVLKEEKKAKKKRICQGCRWDKFERPLNTDFDLYSMGKNGETRTRIDHRQSRDDIIRANNGGYFGLAEAY
jgi:general secretion pathway protein G